MRLACLNPVQVTLSGDELGAGALTACFTAKEYPRI